MELLHCIGKDMLDAAAFLPMGITAGCIWLVLNWIIERKKSTKDRSVRRLLPMFLIVVYITVLLEFAFFSRMPGSRTGIDLILFKTWGKSVQAHSYFIENVIMFLPFGTLFPMKIRKFQSAISCVMAGFVFSVCLELAQLLTSRGHCQLDDVVTNTVGTLIGWLIWRGGCTILTCSHHRKRSL
jgi:glycopeptide antibiotics resistance protein